MNEKGSTVTAWTICCRIINLNCYFVLSLKWSNCGKSKTSDTVIKRPNSASLFQTQKSQSIKCCDFFTIFILYIFGVNAIMIVLKMES